MSIADKFAEDVNLVTGNKPEVVSDNANMSGNMIIAGIAFGGVNEKCYEHIFEFLVRMKANYL